MPGDASMFMHGLEVLGEIKGLDGTLSLRLQVFLEGSAKCRDGQRWKRTGCWWWNHKDEVGAERWYRVKAFALHVPDLGLCPNIFAYGSPNPSWNDSSELWHSGQMTWLHSPIGSFPEASREPLRSPSGKFSEIIPLQNLQFAAGESLTFYGEGDCGRWHPWTLGSLLSLVLVFWSSGNILGLLMEDQGNVLCSQQASFKDVQDWDYNGKYQLIY